MSGIRRAPVRAAPTPVTGQNHRARSDADRPHARSGPVLFTNLPMLFITCMIGASHLLKPSGVNDAKKLSPLHPQAIAEHGRRRRRRSGPRAWRVPRTRPGRRILTNHHTVEPFPANGARVLCRSRSENRKPVPQSQERPAHQIGCRSLRRIRSRQDCGQLRQIPEQDAAQCPGHGRR